LVMRDGDHLQAVRQGLHFVRRELHAARGQRTRRPLRRPVLRLSVNGVTDGGGGKRGGGAGDQRPPALETFGRRGSTRRVSGVKYVFATRCTSAVVRFWKMSNSPSAVLMSLWMTTACPSTSALL